MAVGAEPRVARIAMFNADTPVPNVLAKRGSYGAIFHGLLSQAARRVAPHLTIESEEFNVVLGEYPEDPAKFDMLLVTGAAASAYDKDEWISRLGEYLRDAYSQQPQVKLFGSCFGHQLLCQTLLADHGAVVEKDGKGWEVGVHPIRLSDGFVKATGLQSDGKWASPKTNNGTAVVAAEPKTMRLQFIHADHVILPPPTSMPPNWFVVGSTDHCAVQGVYNPGRVLTYQGHFEFDRFVNAETLTVFGTRWNGEVLQSDLDKVNFDDDSEFAAEIVVRFLLDKPTQISDL
ncbi:hypothetical protein PFICI_00121 [Pestalotiopsis fici W106-1]|uniref:Glutamine amidotransferase domain-containing protein n=1 Tax=Pestalotiopsis fici (strain W106-1 / CGMCC3.15140) TaxID=1229662 RepID=W3XJT5_PESFW|nr:uncharacterized protein PFICI_00121 [Pestalotiopsis fici W106-1]ETS86293.1 hypothetical protein PFICI_00121 [Pestalotiopsis fici W106-1]